MRTPTLLALLAAGFAAVGTLDYHAAVVTHNEHVEQTMRASIELDTLTPAERRLLAACARADLDDGADPCAAVQLVRLDGELAGIGPIRGAEGYALGDLAALDGEVRP